ncbi:DUF6266 family protein [Pedobacter cryophilus]|uniref:Uncharacterized protein n=1 Tax=Pedobacter cryophilus TaxID=2571271 RepID=A0A4U1C113_9SPHI|nr:DUF6266 family protein [Pedobacter cryophilus]TKB98644.1 hypothetical protein FA046_05870 [Pedobacter cryophilus]
MGKFQKGILGGFSGKVGTVIGSNWKGIDYMRSLPRRNKKDPTQNQVDVRIKFLLAINFLKPASSIITNGYRNITGSLTPLNYAVSYHLKNAIIGNSPNFELDMAKVVISRGELTGISQPVLSSAVAQTIKFAWTDNSMVGLAKADDQVSVLVYQKDLNLHIILENGAARASGELVLATPVEFSGKDADCWMTVKSAQGKLIATSAYLGKITVL